MEELGYKLLQIVSPVLLAALTWVAAKLALLIQAKVKSETVRGILTRLDDAIMVAVREVFQVVVEEIKSASRDGKLTLEERALVKAKAIATVKSHLGTKGLDELCNILGLDNGGVEKLLSTRVEAAVHDLKRSRTNGISEHTLPFAGSPAGM